MKTQPTASDRLKHRLKDQFVRAFATFHLLEDGDRVLVGLSGGKDSLLLLELLAERSRIHHPRFTVEALHVRMEEISYESDTTYLQEFCDALDVRLHVVTTAFPTPPADESSARRKQKQPCFLCSWARRKQLFNIAQELGCNKIALGHHQDDIINTCLMNLTFQSHFSTMPVKLRMRKMPLTIIRPLCLCQEADIRQYAELRGYEQQSKRCPFEHESNRTSMAAVFQQLKALNPEARYSLWSALETEGKLVEGEG